MTDFTDSYDYSQTGFGQLLTYYNLLERIFELEYFIIKSGSNVLDVLKLENNVFNGLPFWKINSEDETGTSNDNNEGLAQKILNKMVADKRAKVLLADDMASLKTTMT